MSKIVPPIGALFSLKRLPGSARTLKIVIIYVFVMSGPVASQSAEFGATTPRGHTKETAPEYTSQIIPPNTLQLQSEYVTVEVDLSKIVRRAESVGIIGSTPRILDLATSAIFVGTEVLDRARRWIGMTTGFPLPFSVQMRIDPIIADLRSNSYRFDTHIVQLNLAADDDVVAHEVAHAVIDYLKPGWHSGTAIILHEALADMFAVFGSLLRPELLDTVLNETAGDLRRENAATRVVDFTGPEQGAKKSSLRSATTSVTLFELGFESDRVRLPAVTVRGSRREPHFTSEVLTSALYEYFCSIYELFIRDGMDIRHATRLAAERVGTIMLKATHLTPEHAASLACYARALVAANKLFGDGLLDDTLRRILTTRGFFVNATNVLAPTDTSVHFEWYVDPEVRDPVQIIDSIIAFDDRMRQHILAIPISRFKERELLPLLCYDRSYPYPEIVDRNTITIVSDSTSIDGYRALRIKYIYGKYSEPSLDREALFGFDPRWRARSGAIIAFACYLFDPTGRLISANSDRPLDRLQY